MMSSDSMNKKKPDEEQQQKKSNDQAWMWAVGIGLAVIFVILLIFLISAGAGGHFGGGSDYSSYYGPKSSFYGIHDHTEFFDGSAYDWCNRSYDPTSLSGITGLEHSGQDIF